jgi:hypothetical protein
MNTAATEKNYYYALRVTETCSAEEIEEHFHRLVAMVRDGRWGRERQAQDIVRAYIVLSDPAKRREYDKQLAANRVAQQFRAPCPEIALWPDGLPPRVTPHPLPRPDRYAPRRIPNPLPSPGRHTPHRLPRPSHPSAPSPEPPPDFPPPPKTDADPSLFAVITALVLMFVLPVVFIHYYYLWLLGVSRIVCGYVGGIGLWAFLVAPVAIAARIFATFGFLAGASLMAADNRLVRIVGYGNAAAFGFFNTTIVASLVMLGHI